MLKAKTQKGMNWSTVNYTFFQVTVEACLGLHTFCHRVIQMIPQTLQITDLQ